MPTEELYFQDVIAKKRLQDIATSYQDVYNFAVDEIVKAKKGTRADYIILLNSSKDALQKIVDLNPIIDAKIFLKMHEKALSIFEKNFNQASETRRRFSDILLDESKTGWVDYTDDQRLQLQDMSNECLKWYEKPKYYIIASTTILGIGSIVFLTKLFRK